MDSGRSVGDHWQPDRDGGDMDGGGRSKEKKTDGDIQELRSTGLNDVLKMGGAWAGKSQNKNSPRKPGMMVYTCSPGYYSGG
jgi:hypothetical protein